MGYRVLSIILACAFTAACAVGAIEEQCEAYLKGKSLGTPEVLQSHLSKCVETNKADVASKYAPDPKPDIAGATDTSDLSCRYGNPYMNTNWGTCCGWKPHFNWVVATCEPNAQQQTSHFCTGLPGCATDGAAKINYVAAYQFNGEEFVLMDDSTAGELSEGGVGGSYSNGTGWLRHRGKFSKTGGDWTSKWAPSGAGPHGPRGVTPPAGLWILSAENFYYGAFYMLSQLTLNLEAADNPTGTNCWTWEFDAVEGTIGWNGGKTPGNVNQLYSTNNAAVSGCMPVAYTAEQANGNKRNFSVPEDFVAYCRANPTATGCEPWKSDIWWSGGVAGTSRFENHWDEPYVFAVVVDRDGYWVYRWRPDAQGQTGWPGVKRHEAARRLPPRPRPVKNPAGLATDVRGDVDEAVILLPSLLPEAACLRSSIEAVNWQFGANALGAIAYQLDQYKPGQALEGAQNWWAHFARTQMHESYPISVAGIPLSAVANDYQCDSPSSFSCTCTRSARSQ